MILNQIDEKEQKDKTVVLPVEIVERKSVKVCRRIGHEQKWWKEAIVYQLYPSHSMIKW